MHEVLAAEDYVFCQLIVSSVSLESLKVETKRIKERKGWLYGFAA